MEIVWKRFQDKNRLTDHQLKQFQIYYEMVKASNELFNLTALTEIKSVINYHFNDSLMLGECTDLSSIAMIADVGTGAGFPAIPLKIKYPHLKIVMIEVTHKKVHFLQEVIGALGLTDCVIEPIDWRTFLRKTEYPIQMVCARASLQPEELIRMFSPVSAYKDAQLVYWAAQDYLPSPKVSEYVDRACPYVVGLRKRFLQFFKRVTL